MSTAAEDGDELFRLTDIVTKEVSFVDRAANGHRFLLLKRGDMTTQKGAKITEGGDGSLTVETETPPAPTPPAAPAPEEVVLTKATKDRLSAGLTKATEALTALGVLVEAAKVSDGTTEEALPEVIAAGITKASSALADVLPEGVLVEVDKIGRKMSSARLGKLRGAVDALAALVKELGTGEEETPTDDKAKAAKTEEAAKAVTKVIEDAITKSLAPVIATLADIGDAIESQETRIEKIAKTPSGGSQQPAGTEEPVPPRPAPVPVQWGSDLNEGTVPAEKRF